MDMINQRYNFQLVTINNHEKRNEMLEKRISELMDQGAASEQKSLELLNNIHHLKQQLDMAKNENEKLHNNRVMESSDREGIPIIQLQPKQSTLCVPDQASKCMR
jgi:uncharacterized protein YigA (DUF484 family)